MSAEILRGTDWFGEDHMQYEEHPMYTITAAEYAQHLRNEIILQKLMEAGVHNLEGFEAAMRAASAWEDEE
jgi:hypothetical protein